MSMTEALLHKRLAETPEMEPCDGVKLLYQSRFGCGHLLPPDGQLVERIRAEADETPTSADLPPFSFIGNGLCRMNLAAPAVRALPPERLARMMTLTAEDVPPMTEDDERLPGFERELALLRKAAQEGFAPFSAAALDGYLAEYRAAGYPPASHSPRYRTAYRPAYRVISGDFAVLLPLHTPMTFLMWLCSWGFCSRLSGSVRWPQFCPQVEQSCVHSLMICFPP